MRPLLIGTGWFPDSAGGLERYVRGLHEALQAEGAAPHAIVLGPAADAPASVAVAARGDAPLLQRLRAVWRAARTIDADVVDAHFALYALPLLLRRRTRLIVHFHGPWADEELAGRGNRLRAAVKRAVERAVYRRADEIVCLSAASKRLLVERYGITPWRIEVIPPGVDLARFSPGDRTEARERLDVPDDAWVAFAVRRLVPRMGLDVLLEAWREVAAAEPRALLVIAGDGPERAALERLAGERVRFLGPVDDDLLAECYRAADVTVVPSVALEGFGLVAAESLACGTPVVASDLGGLREAVSGTGRDVLVPPGDVPALARRLREAAAGQLPARSRCREVAERYSWQAAAARHLNVYAREPDERLRVVYLDHTARLSGAELSLLRLLGALDVSAHVILGEDGPLANRLSELGISVEVLPLDERARGLKKERVGGAALSSAAGARTAAHTARLALRLHRLRPDIVHTNSLKAALYGGLAGRLARVPVVWQIHDRIADDYLPASAVRLMHHAARLPTATMVNSEATRATLPSRAQAVVVPVPVSVSAARQRASGPLRVGMVGRIAPWKGQDVFIEAFARAFPGGDEEARVVGAPLFGADEEAYAADLPHLARRLGLKGRVEFTGFRDDVSAELGQLDVLVHASTLPEPFGQVVVEGMSAGLPVIAADAGGPATLVADGTTGLLYPPGDASALAAALRRLAGDPELRRLLGDRARESAGAFSPERVAVQVLEVYRGVMDR